MYTFDALAQRTTADQFEASTPCEGWDVRTLIGHQCAVVNGVQAVAATGALAKPTPPEDMSDPIAAWNATRSANLSTLDRQGVLHQQGPFWFEAATVDDMIGIVLWDVVGHSWDLAQATGQHHYISDNLAEAALAVAAPMSDMLVETKRTGPALSAADNASVLDQYLAVIGRQSN